MQEYLNLDEAARELGISKEDLNQKAQKRDIRAFADRGTWKFRKKDIEEAKRQAGIGSGAEIVFGDLDDALPALDSSGSSDQILLGEHTLPDAGPGGSAARVIGMDEFGRTPSDSDVRLVPEGAAKKGSDSDVKLVPGAKPPSDSDVKMVGGARPPSDSDVKVVAGPGKGLSDSDVKVKGPSPADSDVRLDRAKAPSDSGIRIAGAAVAKAGADVTQDLPVFGGLSDEELAITSGSSGEQPTAQPDSDFELTVGEDKKQGDSDITLALDDGLGLEEIKLAPAGPSDSDVTKHSPSASGVNLSSPADSGIALDAAPKSPGKSGRGGSGPSKPASDIFETDFDVPVLDDAGASASSGGDTAHLTADSDFELSGSDAGESSSDSSSQVLSLEGEEAADESAKTSLAPAPKEEQWEEELEEPTAFEEESGAIPAATSGEMPSDEHAPAMTPAAMVSAGAEQDWGMFTVGGLCFNAVIMLLLFVIMFDLARATWGLEGSQPLYRSPMLNWLAGLFFGK